MECYLSEKFFRSFCSVFCLRRVSVLFFFVLFRLVWVFLELDFFFVLVVGRFVS